MFVSEFVVILLEVLDGEIGEILDILLSDFSFVFVVFVLADEEFDFIGSLFAPAVDQLFPDRKEEGL